jgi:hypothetical protein
MNLTQCSTVTAPDCASADISASLISGFEAVSRRVPLAVCRRRSQDNRLTRQHYIER